MTLYTSEYLFFCDTEKELHRFPDIELNFDYPSIISNAIIEINSSFNYEMATLIRQLENLFCYNIELRIYDTLPLNEIIKIIRCFDESMIENITLFIKFESQFNRDDILNFKYSFPRITQLIVHSSSVDLIDSNAGIFFISTFLENNNHCGRIELVNFNSNIEFISEVQRHNSCLNRKISIDTQGNIKNCPSLPEVYGNINDPELDLSAIVASPAFQKYWYIHKDQISICKDCEFRYICTDCRAYRQDPDDLFSKPAKCSYDPYTATWGAENTSNNVLYGQ